MVTLQTLTLAGHRFVVIPEAEYKRLAGKTPEPMLPLPDTNGNYPPVETMRAMMARKIIRRRRTVGLSQVELARRAGIRPETLNRLEQGKHSASIATVDKLDRASAKRKPNRGSGKNRRRPLASDGRVLYSCFPNAFALARSASALAFSPSF